MPRTLLACLKVLGLLLVSAPMMPAQALILLITRGEKSHLLPQFWHRCVCRILALRVRLAGQIHSDSRCVYVGNHVSHFDIFVLGSLLRAAFIAKGEMQTWPVAGWIAGLQQTLFISRNAKDAGRVLEQLAGVMRLGGRMILFPEGTTSAGLTVAPFKSSLFSILVSNSECQWAVQPFTLELTQVNGVAPHRLEDRDIYAFYGAMHMTKHFWNFLKSRGAQLTVHFHPVIAPEQGLDRKALAALSHKAVASGLAKSRGAVDCEPRL